LRKEVLGPTHGAAAEGLALNLSGEQCAAHAKAKAPRIAPLCGDIQRRKSHTDGAGALTVDVTVQFSDLAAGQVILDSRDDAGRGYVLRTTDRGAVRFEMCDGWQAAFWDSDAGLLKTSTLHHIAAIVDGRSKVMSFVIDGALNDGGAERQFGWGRFSPNIKDISGGRDLRVATDLHGDLRQVRIYNRALRTSDAVANFLAIPRKL
jgi:hypothetical protein